MVLPPRRMLLLHLQTRTNEQSLWSATHRTHTTPHLRRPCTGAVAERVGSALAALYAMYCGSSKERIGTSSRLRLYPLCDATVAVREDLCLADLAEGNDEKSTDQGKIGVSTHPGSVVIHVHDEDGVRTKPGGARRLKINLSLVTGHATCV